MFGNLTPSLPSVEVIFAKGNNDPYSWNLDVVKWGPSPKTMPFKRYYNSALDEHWVTTGTVETGYSIEDTLGYLYMAGKVANTQPLFGCQANNDYFVSVGADCEGWLNLGINGWIYSSPPAGITTRPLYRCRNGSDHFVSKSSGCEGAVYEYFLGYAAIAAVP